jgi:hypothetical protein
MSCNRRVKHVLRPHIDTSASSASRATVLRHGSILVSKVRSLQHFQGDSLRDHGEFMTTGGRGMSNDKLDRLRSWWRMLREGNLVLEFAPDIPPNPGVSPHGGFAYRERVSANNDLLIRVNEHTRLTEEGIAVWCWPTDLTQKSRCVFYTPADVLGGRLRPKLGIPTMCGLRHGTGLRQLQTRLSSLSAKEVAAP